MGVFKVWDSPKNPFRLFEGYKSSDINDRLVGFADGSNGSIIKVWKEGTKQVTEERSFVAVEDCEPYNGHRDQEDNSTEDDEESLDLGQEVWQLSIGIRGLRKCRHAHLTRILN